MFVWLVSQLNQKLSLLVLLFKKDIFTCLFLFISKVTCFVLPHLLRSLQRWAGAKGYYLHGCQDSQDRLLSSLEPRKLSTFDCSLYILANQLPWPESGSSFLALVGTVHSHWEGNHLLEAGSSLMITFFFLLTEIDVVFPYNTVSSPTELETPFLVVALPSDPICNFGKLVWASAPPVTKITLARGQLEDEKV